MCWGFRRKHVSFKWMFSFACFVFFFFYFFVLAHQKLFCWSWTPSVAQRAALSHRIFYFAFVSSAILYVLVLDLGDLICSGLVWPHRRKQSRLHPNHLFNVFLSFIYYLQPRFVRRSGSRLNIPPVPVNVMSSLKNEQVQAARQETAGGRQKIFLCGVLVSLLNSLDNNACGEDKRYEGRMCLKVWESVERQKKRWIELVRLFMLRSLDMYLEFISIKAVFSSTMEAFQFCIWFLFWKSFYRTSGAKKWIHPTAVRLHQTDLLSSVGSAWLKSCYCSVLFDFPLIVFFFFFHSTAQVLPQALPQPVPRRDIQGAVPHLRRSRPRDRVREGRARRDVQRWEKGKIWPSL